MSTYKENLKKNVRQLRLAAGLSQRELGKMCRRTDRFISAVETTPRNVTIETLEVLATALGCTILDLLGPIKTPGRPGERIKRPVESIQIPKSAGPGLDAAIRLLSRAKRSLKRL